jgi:hypothetical protein
MYTEEGLHRSSQRKFSFGRSLVGTNSRDQPCPAPGTEYANHRETVAGRRLPAKTATRAAAWAAQNVQLHDRFLQTFQLGFVLSHIPFFYRGAMR